MERFLSIFPGVKISMNKSAFQPIPGGQPAIDPAMAQGTMPMDPSMMQGQPAIDPAMAQGTMPMDPSMMQGAMPMDPAMMAAGGMPQSVLMDPNAAMSVAEMTVNDFKQMLREVIADVMTGGKGEEESDKKDTTLSDLSDKVNMLMDSLGLLQPAEQGSSSMMGAGAGVPAQPSMEAQATSKSSTFSLADTIITHAIACNKKR